MTRREETSTPQTVTLLLSRIDSGDDAAVEELFGQVYGHIRQLVRQKKLSTGDRNLLQTTAIVNEACLRIRGSGFRVSHQNRRHLFASVNQAIQRVLVDYARKRNALKRSGDDNQILSDMLQRYERACDGDILDLEQALDSLRGENPRAAKVAHLKFWGALTLQESAEVLDLSLDTIKRDWRFARAYLKAHLSSEG
ncbi:MAG: ECF-type sigma factor [Planctomycetota bacterium]